MKKRVFITVHDFNLQVVKDIKAHDWDISISKKNQKYDLTDLIENYDALIIGVNDRINKTIYKSDSRCKFIGTLSVGLDHVSDLLDIEGLIIESIAGYNAQSVSEFVWGQIISISRGIYLSHFSEYERSVGRKYELQGKTIGVIGAGNIGGKVLEQAKAFDLKRTSYTKYPNKHIKLQEEGVEFVGISELLSKSDIIVLTVPFNDETRNFITEKRIAMMKESAVFVSISREGVFDVNALVQAVKNNKLHGVAIDSDKVILDDEINNSNVLVTPHIAGLSVDANNRADYSMAGKLINHFNNNNGNS